MTLFAVFSDIHANYSALCAAADDARESAKSLNDELYFLCLGDVVDYGPQPNECMLWIRDPKNRVLAVVKGNHDNDVATGAITHDLIWLPISYWTRHSLLPDHQNTIKYEWPETRVLDGSTGLKNFTLHHASPCESLSGYLKPELSIEDWHKQLYECSETPYILAGHTHLPCYLTLKHSKLQFMYALDDALHLKASVPDNEGWKPLWITNHLQDWIELPKVGTSLALRNNRALINPGSIGQPRPFGKDLPGDTRASYVLLQIGDQSSKFQFRRVEYNPKESTIPLLREVRWQPKAENIEVFNTLREKLENINVEKLSRIDKNAIEKMQSVLHEADILKYPKSSTNSIQRATNKLNELTAVCVDVILLPLLEQGRRQRML